MRWYLWGARGKLTNNNASNDYHTNSVNKIGKWTIGCVLLLHSTQIGVLWRYFKLFIPVNLTYVKHEVHVYFQEESPTRERKLTNFLSYMSFIVLGAGAVCIKADTRIL